MGFRRIPAHIAAIEEANHVHFVDGCASMGARHRIAACHRRTTGQRTRNTGLDTMERPLDKCK
jgi:hypothetical protein